MAKVDTFKLKGQILDARYQVESVVGEGGFGVVYRATQVNFEEPVAIKVLKIPGHLAAKDAEVFIETFRAEGKHLRKLSAEHPAFVRAHDTGVINVDGVPAPYLVLEWLDGAPLEDDLAERREHGEHGRSLQESMAILEPIFGALAHAHAQRVAHRDIKPANIFLARTRTGTTAKLLDFGMAKVMTASGTQGFHAATQGGLSGLTPAYAASEQWDRTISATGPWSDVYSLALVLVELLTDKPPLDGDDLPSLMLATLDEEVRPTPTARGATVDPSVEAVFAKAVALNPKDRYLHAGEFWNALLEVAEPAAVGTTQTLARIALPSGDVLEPGDLPPEGRPSPRAAMKSKPSLKDPSLPATITTDAATNQSAKSSSPEAVAKQSSVAAQSQVTSESTVTASAAEKKKSSNAVVGLLLALVVVLGIMAWKMRSGAMPDVTKTALVTTPDATPSATGVAETPKPKKKRTRWWEDLPDPNDTTGKTTASKLPSTQQKWLTMRAAAEALAAEKKFDEASAAIAPARDLACTELGQDDPACVETLELLARLLIKLGKYDEAEKLLREAVEINEKYAEPGDDDFDDSRQALIAVLVKQGKTEEAQKFWKPTDPALPPPKTSASAAPSAASTNIKPTARPREDDRDPWSQIVDEISQEQKTAPQPAPSSSAQTP